jgi:hypothetical protein
VRAWGENPYPCAPAPRISCSRLRAPSAGKQAARRGAPVVAGRTSRNGPVSLAAQDADHSMITRDLGVRDRTGRAQHSADDGLHDNDVGLPSFSLLMSHIHTHTHTHTQTHKHTLTHRHGNAESIRRAFEILTSCLCCGRSTESSYIVRDSIVVDLYHKCVMVEVPMTKVAAYKMVPFVASPHRHLDWWACVCVCVCACLCVCGWVRACVCTYIHSFMHVKHTQVSHVDSVHQHGGLRGA